MYNYQIKLLLQFIIHIKKENVIKIPKFWHPDLLREESFSSSSNESNSLDQSDQIGGQTSPIPGPSNAPTATQLGSSTIQQTQQDQLLPAIPSPPPSNTTVPTPGPSGIQENTAAQLPLDNSAWFEEETKVFQF